MHQRLDARLELRRRRSANRQRDRHVQQGRSLVRLQVGVEFARELPVLLRAVGQRAVRGLQLLAEGDVGVDDPAPHARDRLAIAEPARMHHRVDRERQRLQRREQQLGAARELGLLRQRAHPQQRLMRAPRLAIHDQRAVLLEHRRIRVTHQVGAERLVGRHPVRRLDDQRARLPVVIQQWLGDTARARPSQQPLQLPRRRPAHRQRRLRPAERALLGHDQRVDLRRRDRHRVRDPEDALDPSSHPVDPR